jgi:hypothetical protein
MTIALYIIAYYVSVLVVYGALWSSRDRYFLDAFGRAALATLWPLALTAVVLIAPFALIDKLLARRRGNQ